MSLILRQSNLPNTGSDFIKGSPLTYDQLDGNFAAISASLAITPINPGPGIIINGQDISASVVTVNGIFPVNGNVAVSLTNVITGPLITRPFTAADATVFVVSQDSPNNGDAYIFVASTGTWEAIAPLDQVQTDALYLRLDTANDPMQGSLNMGGNNITNVGTIFGTATTASFITASGVYGPFGGNSIISASIATTASFITGSNIQGPLGANSVVSASYALSASYLTNVPDTSRIVSGSTVVQTYSSGVVDVSGSSTSTTKLTVSGSVVVGYNTATGLNAVAFGTASTAAGDYSLVQGKNNTVTVAATNGHAEGESTYVGAQAAHAEGYYTSASQAYAHAEGYNTVAGGQYSHAEGNSTTTQGFFSHAEGVGTVATAQGAHAEGFYTTASGDFSHAEGSGSIALGIGSHAEGLGTIASGSYQLAIGKYNQHSDTTSLFVIGNGSSAGTRSNVVSVTPTSVEITGSLLTTGNVGIGTPTPATSLDVNGWINTTSGLAINGSSWSSGVPSGGGRITFTSSQLKYEAGSGAGFAHNVITNAISRLYVNDNGVGIGTTTPSYSLHIATTTSSGSLNVNNVLYVSQSRVEITGSLNVTSGIIGSLVGTASWAANAITASHALTVQGGLNNYTPLWTGSTQLTSSVLYQSGSRIGINLLPAAFPATALQVNGTITVGQSGSSTGQRIDFIRTDGNAMTGMSAANTGIIQVGGGNINYVDIYTANEYTARFSNITSAPTTPGLNLRGPLLVSGSGYAGSVPHMLTVTGSGAAGVMNINNVLLVSGSNTIITGSLAISGSGTLTNIGTTSLTGSLLVTGSTTQTGDNTLRGNTILSGSISVSGSQIFVGSQTLTGSFLVSGSTTQIGNNTLTGNTSLTGSITISGSTTNTIIGNTNITGSLNVIGNINVVSGSAFTRWGNKLFNYGAFSDYTTQSGSANTAHPIKLNTTDFSLGISLSGSSAIKIENTGIYNFQWSGQLSQGAGAAVVSIWIKINGTDVPGSRGDVTLASSDAALPAWNYVLSFNANDAIELYWSSNSANTTWVFSPTGSTPPRPSTASIIATLTQIA